MCEYYYIFLFSQLFGYYHIFLFNYVYIMVYSYSSNYWLLYNYSPCDLYHYDFGVGWLVLYEGCVVRGWCHMAFCTLLI